MAQELFVDLRYQGIELGRRLQFDSVVASGAYLHAPAPMPVGTVLTIDVDDGQEVTVRVTRVSEQVAGSERPAGMFVEPHELSGSAQDLWNSWAGGAEAPAAEPEASAAETEPEASAAETASAAEPEASAAEPKAEEEPPAKPKAKKKKRKSRKKAKA